MQNFELLQNRLSLTHLPALDGLRFVAVFLVIFYHCGFEKVPGGHGVMLFFVLSGFLITWLLLKENERTGTISLTGFFKRRVLRIFPAFYAFALVTIFLLAVGKKQIPWAHALSSFFYFSNYYGAMHPESNNAFSHTWSLAVEEQFYLFFPLLFLLFCRNLRQLTTVICGIILAAWVWRIVLVFGLNVREGYIYSAFETRLDNLLVGCLLAIVLRKKFLRSFWQIVLTNAFAPIVTCALLAISIYFGQTSLIYKSTVGFAFEPVLMAILIVQAITFSGQGFWRWFGSRPVTFLGSLSYSLYLYQQLTTSIVLNRFHEAPFIVSLSVTILATISSATLSFYLIETPFLQLKTMPWQDVISYNLLKLRLIFAPPKISQTATEGFPQQQETKQKGKLIDEKI